jgi:sugar/nucleoside kinase (ribokinase family)
MKKVYDIVGIGSPLLDIIVEVEEAVLLTHGLKKGGMHLVDSVRSESILASLKQHPKTYISGGSSANTIAGASLLGSRGLFLGVIGDDAHGTTYEAQMRKANVKTDLIRHVSEPTGVAITFITPDGERTFATYLGAAKHFGSKPISLQAIGRSKILHIEGYLLDDEAVRGAAVRAMQYAKEQGTLVSLDLSAVWLITKNIALLKQIVQDYVDIVFVNEDEALAFTGKQEGEALQSICDLCDIAVVKLGARGSLVQSGTLVYTIDPHAVELINTNGAGDMYAAGFLHSLAQGHTIESAGKVGSHMAGLVVASPGARLHETHYHKIAEVLKQLTEIKPK